MKQQRARGKERKSPRGWQLWTKELSCVLQSHLTCIYLHAVQSQHNWGFPAGAKSVSSSTYPLEGKRRGQSAADAAKELQNKGAQSGMAFLQRPDLPWAAQLKVTLILILSQKCQPNMLGC